MEVARRKKARATGLTGYHWVVDENFSTEILLKELRETQTDLARLVEHVLARKLSVVTLTSQMVAAWEQRAPEAWAKVKQWLRARNVKIVIVPAHPET